MKLIVFTDAHANLPALLAFKKAIARESYDVVIHTGDAIDIGPYPAECLEELLHIPRIQFLMGNHEEFLVKGIPQPRPTWMAEDEEQHYRWTFAQLPPKANDIISRWPYIIRRQFEQTAVTFVHYGLTAGEDGFVSFVKDPTAQDWDAMFASFTSALVFFGHDHRASDHQGEARYINPGALGCGADPVARYCVVEFSKTGYTLKYRAVSYDRLQLFAEYERRNVPAREFIMKAFFGR